MPFEQKKDGAWQQVTEREAFIALTNSSFRFPALAMEQMEEHPMQMIADSTVSLEMRFNPDEPAPCTGC